MSDRYPPWYRPLRRQSWVRTRYLAMAHAGGVVNGAIDASGRHFTDVGREGVSAQEVAATERFLARLLRDREYRASFERAKANLERVFDGLT